MRPDTRSTLEALEAIDHAEAKLRSGAISGTEAIEAIAHAVAELVGHCPCDPTEVDFVYDYGQEAAERVGTSANDPVLVEYYSDSVAAYEIRPLLETRLELMLESIAAHYATGHPAEGLESLVELCARGAAMLPLTFRYSDLVSKVLTFAHTHSASQALAAAVDPLAPNRGCIASPGRAHRASREALDLLAHLAADPHAESGREARDALVRFAGSVELGAPAAVRLPLHLLDDTHRMELLQVLEARIELFVEDSILAPASLPELRHTQVIRTAIWQAFDACRV
jgi:hypothetical protein